MAKKIYDILPPKLASKVEDTIKAFEKDNKKRTSGSSRKRTGTSLKRATAVGGVPSRDGKRGFPLKEVLIGGFIVLILLGIYLFTKLPKADILISPKMDTIEIEEKITADKSANEIVVAKKTIPARYLEEQQSGSQEFAATGSASNDGKATGTITIYNKLNPVGPFTLITGTHFLSNSGKYFVTTQKVTIPAAKYQNGKLVPGSVNATVQAKEAGEEYNIGASKFSIPKLSGTSYYYSISAESTDAMKGGHVGSVKKVTKDDVDTAKDVLTKKLLEQAEKLLRSKLSEDDILLESAMAKNVIEFKTSATENTVAEKFRGDAKVKVSALVFKKQDLEKFAKEAIDLKLPDDQSYLPESLNINYEFEVVDISGGVAKMDITASAKTYQSIDIDKLVNLVSMEDANQIKESIDQVYGDSVLGVKVDFWPMWVKAAPKNKNRIKIDLKFE